MLSASSSLPVSVVSYLRWVSLFSRRKDTYGVFSEPVDDEEVCVTGLDVCFLGFVFSQAD